MKIPNNFNKGRLFIISGIDGSGKSTLLRSLIARCEGLGANTVKRKFRSGFLKSIYLFLKPGSDKDEVKENSEKKDKSSSVPKNPVTKRIYLLITLLDIVLYVLRLRWDLLLRRVIVMDRYYWDSLVELEEKFPTTNITGSVLWRLAVSLAPVPDAAFLLYLTTNEAIRRMEVRNTQLTNPYHIQSFDILEKRNLRYQELSREGHWIVLDATETPDVLLEKAWDIVAK